MFQVEAATPGGVRFVDEHDLDTAKLCLVLDEISKLLLRYLNEGLVVVHALFDARHFTNDDLTYFVVMSKLDHQAAGLVHVVIDVICSLSSEHGNLLRVLVMRGAFLHRHGDALKMGNPIVNVAVHGLQWLPVYDVAVISVEERDRPKVGKAQINRHDVVVVLWKLHLFLFIEDEQVPLF